MGNLNIDWKTVLALGGIALVFYYIAKKDAEAAAVAVGQAVNPVSPSNIFAKAANAVTGAVTGTPSLGAEIYNVLHPGQ